MHPRLRIPEAKTVVAARTMGCVIIFWTLVDMVQEGGEEERRRRGCTEAVGGGGVRVHDRVTCVCCVRRA